jgi:Fur family ferric uptake transcriptional regulator
LTGKNKRTTVQRQVILEELKKLKTHPTADELYQRVRKLIPRISLGTVYRNLERLVDEGLALRLDSGLGPRRYDGFTKKHYHIQCVDCYRLDDIMLKLKPEPKYKYPRLTDYAVQGFRVEFFGICPVCLKDQQKMLAKENKTKREDKNVKVNQRNQD